MIQQIKKSIYNAIIMVCAGALKPHGIRLVLISLFFICNYTKGQNFSGRILRQNGSPLSEAVVLNVTQLSADYTDENGRFNIHAEYGDSILIHDFYDDMKIEYAKGVHDITFIGTKQFLYYKPLITDNVINEVNGLFLREKYKDCIALCLYYIGNYIQCDAHYKSHPYRDWYKEQGFWGWRKTSTADNYALLCYLGGASAYQQSLTGEWDSGLLFNGIAWSKSCIAIYDDYLKEEKPENYWSAEKMYNYILCGERGITATSFGEHFLSGIKDKWAKQERKWIDKRFERISYVLYKNTLNRETLYSDYPFLRYKISTIGQAYQLKKGKLKFKEFQDFYKKRFNAVIDLIKSSENGDSYNSQVHIALSSLKSVLCNLVIESEALKKLGDGFERFCMEELIKLQDISYYLNGSSRYSLSTDYSLQDIQNRLKETDCAIIHFEAPVASGHFYSMYDLSSRYRNYALVITKNQEQPDIWHRGYISDKKVNDLSSIKERYPNANRFFFVGTPRMSFIDIAGKDSSIVRLHSLSQLIHNEDDCVILNEVTFIGNLNYSKVGNKDVFSDNKGGASKKQYEQLAGPFEELQHIKKLYNNITPITGDSANRGIVASEISRCRGILHISTHGDTSFNPENDIDPEALILKKNILDNSRLILSGYNDSPDSPLTYISGSDVLKLKKIKSSVVFLDACLSGRGAVSVSGSVGISEAFHLVGAKNIICYLEPIEDDIATDFSNIFYKALSNGKTCHEAFFIAKNSINQNIKVVLWE